MCNVCNQPTCTGCPSSDAAIQRGALDTDLTDAQVQQFKSQADAAPKLFKPDMGHTVRNYTPPIRSQKNTPPDG